MQEIFITRSKNRPRHKDVSVDWKIFMVCQGTHTQMEGQEDQGRAKVPRGRPAIAGPLDLMAPLLAPVSLAIHQPKCLILKFVKKGPACPIASSLGAVGSWKWSTPPWQPCFRAIGTKNYLGGGVQPVGGQWKCSKAQWGLIGVGVGFRRARGAILAILSSLSS